MRRLKDTQEFLSWLPRLVKGRRHWLFFADAPEGSDLLVCLALVLRSPRGLVGGDTCLATADRAIPVPFSFLAIPKRVVARDDLREALRWACRTQQYMTGAPDPLEDCETDMVLITETEAGHQAVERVLLAIERRELGACRPAGN
jgi:hypothetical protein